MIATPVFHATPDPVRHKLSFDDRGNGRTSLLHDGSVIKPLKRMILVTLNMVLCAAVVLSGCERMQMRKEESPDTLYDEPFPVLDDWRFLERDTHIDEYRLWDRSFGQIKEQFGEPTSIHSYEIFPPAADPEWLMIAEYPGFEVDFAMPNRPEETDLCSVMVTFFDITGPQYPFKGIVVGMTQPEITELPEDSILFDMEVLKTTKEITTMEAWQSMLAKKVLSDYRPIDYYKDYDHFLYMECWDEITDDPDWPGEHHMALGAVVLFQDGKVARIVFGFPMAG